ncbi:MAG TPA: non-canonical purine NTP pyrophosphatase [Candidatus Levybacteria bacterium]|nr:non-canonical purine NTP pyrophosphatase [Candidatus Levybacteria bacterium]
MISLYYITSNIEKITVANKYLHPLGISVEQKDLDFDELQSDSIEAIAQHKAEQAYSKLKHPVLVNDAAWYISSLNGFPGPFMKQINTWFTEQDILNLMHDKPNRDVIYKDVFCYMNKDEIKFFIGEVKGKILKQPQGTGKTSWTLFSFSSTGKSIAQCWEEGIDPVDDYKIWHEIAHHFKNKNLES